MLSLVHLYLLLAALFASVGVLSLRDAANRKRFGTAAFWLILAALFGLGDWMPRALAGLGVLALAVLAGTGQVGNTRGPAKPAAPREGGPGMRLFLPALAIPLLTLAGTFALKWIEIDGRTLVDTKQATLFALALACVLALAWACRMTRSSPLSAIDSSRPMLDSIGWAVLLPLLLAMLGTLFARAGVGDIVAQSVTAVLPADYRFLLVLAYALGMALFTIIMGNAFAAFPVMTAGIGLPLLVQGQGADAASLAAIGMLSGYCGTLMTPMAANFNIVPVALLELQDKYAVIRAQFMTGVWLLAANVVLMYLIVFR
jgi:uncharacterized membrane protein